MLATKTLTSIPNTYVPEPDSTPKGEFVGVQHKFTNNGSSGFASANIDSYLSVTNGTQFWEEASYSGGYGALSGEVALLFGGTQAAVTVEPGFSSTVWAVYDVPLGTELKAIRYRTDNLGSANTPVWFAVPPVTRCLRRLGTRKRFRDSIVTILVNARSRRHRRG